MKKATLTCICMFIASTILAQVSKQEKQALLNLYSATNGSQWNNQWDLEAPVETWYGITVDNNKVIGINLLFNNLNGTLPGSLGQLENLKRLELSFNSISGIIPAELGNLKQLEVLAINGTSVNGNIPESLGTLSNLKELHLSSNQLSGTIPESLGNLKKIEIFNVFDNNLFGTLPQGLANCQNIKQMMVAENNLTDQNDFSVILLSNSGAKMNLFENSPHIESSQSIIAVERDESED
ncbi:Two component regulator three Y domain protein [Aequorivita sp. CIP111184]|uniref:leucine-rich repeat domain-containing protein n=1 Tax=Aequorivita sp. CIP111184 TaxID=2211356 RepID=UPI000DBC0D14|nr:Two component regulator three Y domain protein [Aequorivita sp. CIP111184]SRX54941.1 hypothetical protein AEQU1_01961 [Aequorivita sp. CIP111184]